MASLIVPEDVRGLAYALIQYYFTLRSVQESLNRPSDKWPRTFKQETIKHVRTCVSDLILQHLPIKNTEEFHAAVQAVLHDLIKDYLHIYYLAQFELLPFSTLIAFLVFSPQATWKSMYSDAITPDAYIKITFFPGPVKSSKQPEHYETTLVKSYVITLFRLHIAPPALLVKSKNDVTPLVERLEEKMSLGLREVFVRLYHVELKKRENKLHAFLIAARETARYIIASMWLLTTYVAYKKNIVKPVGKPIEILPIRCLRLFLRRWKMFRVPLPLPETLLARDQAEAIDSVLKSNFNVTLQEVTWSNLVRIVAQKLKENPAALLYREARVDLMELENTETIVRAHAESISTTTS